MFYLVILLAAITAILIVMKLILCELDGRRANKQYNLRYFLMFNEPFRYGKAKNMIFIAFICLLIFGDFDLTTLSGVLYLLLFLVASVVMDIISQAAYYLYGKQRFQKGVQKAVEVRQRLIDAISIDDYDNINYPVNSFSFADICEKQFQDDYHIAISSMDGGRFASKLNNLPYVTFVIEHFDSLARELLKDKPIKVTTLTANNGLPFKDEKLDLYVVNYSNFDKKDVHRVLKPNGTLILRHKGNFDMNEINMNIFNRLQNNQWNVKICSDILNTNGFYVTNSQEVNEKVEFYSIEALLTYIKRNTPDQKINIDLYLNQFAFIDANIKQKGHYALTMHEFYIIAKKI